MKLLFVPFAATAAAGERTQGWLSLAIQRQRGMLIKLGFNQTESSLLVIHAFKIRTLVLHSERRSASPTQADFLARPERMLCYTLKKKIC